MRRRTFVERILQYLSWNGIKSTRAFSIRRCRCYRCRRRRRRCLRKCDDHVYFTLAFNSKWYLSWIRLKYHLFIVADANRTKISCSHKIESSKYGLRYHGSESISLVVVFLVFRFSLIPRLNVSHFKFLSAKSSVTARISYKISNEERQGKVYGDCRRAECVCVCAR